MKEESFEGGELCTEGASGWKDLKAWERTEGNDRF